MAKYREVPKSLVSLNADDLSEDTELIPPELLFEDYENDQLNSYTLPTPESLFGKSALKKIRLKAPEDLFGKDYKTNGKEPKNLTAKKDKKSGK
jgi:hypothetical protein